MAIFWHHNLTPFFGLVGGPGFTRKYVHKMFTNQIALKPLDYFSMAAFRMTRNSHSKKIMPKFGRVDAVKFSFFFWVIPIRNSLPENIVNQSATQNPFTVYVETISANNRCVDICIDPQWVVNCIFDDDDDDDEGGITGFLKKLRKLSAGLLQPEKVFSEKHSEI